MNKILSTVGEFIKITRSLLTIILGYNNFSHIGNNVVGDYLKIKKINILSAKYKIGVYKKNGYKYLIKGCPTDIKSFDYYDLLSEYKNNILLYRLNTSKKVKIVKPVKLVYKNKYVYFVQEFIEGKKSRTTNKDFWEVIENLKKIYDLHNEKLSKIKKRQFLFYLLFYPIVAVIYAIKKVPKIVELNRSLKLFLYFISNHKKLHFSICHNDLSGKNLIKVNNKVYLTDNSSISIGYMELDISSLSEHAKKPIAEIDTKLVDFFKSYTMMLNTII